MIIVIGAAKSLNRTNTKLALDLFFPNQSEYIYNILKTFSQSELKTFFKLSDKKSKELYDLYADPDIDHAYNLYNGAVFKELNTSNYQKLFILDAMYGLIRYDHIIASYRLDFSKKLREIDLYEYWQELVNQKLLSLDEEIVLISSKEYHKLINIKHVLIDFKTNCNIKRKKLRGKMANYLLNHDLKIKDIPSISFDDIVFDSKIDNIYYFTKKGH